MMLVYLPTFESETEFCAISVQAFWRTQQSFGLLFLYSTYMQVTLIGCLYFLLMDGYSLSYYS